MLFTCMPVCCFCLVVSICCCLLLVCIDIIQSERRGGYSRPSRCSTPPGTGWHRFDSALPCTCSEIMCSSRSPSWASTQNIGQPWWPKDGPRAWHPVTHLRLYRSTGAAPSSSISGSQRGHACIDSDSGLRNVTSMKVF